VCVVFFVLCFCVCVVFCVLCFCGCLFCYVFPSINEMICSSPACSRKIIVVLVLRTMLLYSARTLAGLFNLLDEACGFIVGNLSYLMSYFYVQCLRTDNGMRYHLISQNHFMELVHCVSE
jgi:hypothetical protein